jgi:hypothetical protein
MVTKTGFITQNRSIFMPASCGPPKDQPQDMDCQEVMKLLLKGIAVLYSFSALSPISK